MALSLLFFLIVAVFWVVKPVKRGLLLSHHDVPVELLGWTLEAAQLEQLAKGLNMFAALVAVAAFTRAVRIFERRRLLIVLCGTCSGVFALFAVLVTSPGPGVVWSLYVFGDVYATMMVGAFWALTNDLTSPGQAERSYGLIGLGGVVGGFVGATVVRGWVETTGRTSLLFGCAVTLVIVAFVAVRVDAMAKGKSARLAGPLVPHDGTSAWLEGAKLTLRSRYLLALVALVSSYEIVSSVVDFQLAVTVAATVDGSTQKDAFFGMVGQLVGVVSILVQLLMTSWIMRHLGIAVALLVLPMAILGGSIGFLVVPSLAVAAIMSTSDNALNYSVNQSAREALYVPLTRDEKYKAKAFIDMFIQRAAKVGAVMLNLAVAERMGLGRVRWLSLAVIALVGVWIALARWMARRHAELATEPPAEAVSPDGKRPRRSRP
jgi:ATP:ADP antiporter, AAA family